MIRFTGMSNRKMRLVALKEGYWFTNDELDRRFALCEDERDSYQNSEFGIDPLLGAPQTSLFLNEVYGTVNGWNNLNDPDRIEYQIVNDPEFKQETTDIINDICSYLNYDPAQPQDPNLPPLRCRPLTVDADTAAHRSYFRVLMADTYSKLDPSDDLCQFLSGAAEKLITAAVIAGGTLLLTASVPAMTAAVVGSAAIQHVASTIDEKIGEEIEKAVASVIDYEVEEWVRNNCGIYERLDEALADLRETPQFQNAVSSRICKFVDPGSASLEESIVSGQMACDTRMKKIMDRLSAMASQHGCSSTAVGLSQTYIRSCAA